MSPVKHSRATQTVVLLPERPASRSNFNLALPPTSPKICELRNRHETVHATHINSLRVKDDC